VPRKVAQVNKERLALLEERKAELKVEVLQARESNTNKMNFMMMLTHKKLMDITKREIMVLITRMGIPAITLPLDLTE
jgi:hypothetical protein